MIEPYKPLFIHLNPASIPEVVAHIQKYLTENEFVTVDDFGQQFQEYIDAHPDIIKVGSVNGLTGDVVLTSQDITMTGGTSETLGTVIGDILEDASATGETVDDLVLDMDVVKTDIATLENVFTGATEESSGVKGLVPAPANTQTSHYLKATGDFEAIPARDVISNAVSEGGTVEEALSYFKSHEIATTITEQKITINNPTIPINTFYTISEFQLPSDGDMYLVTIYFTLPRYGSTSSQYIILTNGHVFYDEESNAATFRTAYTFVTTSKTIQVQLYLSNSSNISKIEILYNYVKLR